MGKSSYIARRFKDKAVPPFPVHPVWAAGQDCLGFVSMTNLETISAALKKHRRNILGVWTGSLEGVGALTITAFESSAVLDATLSAALPLQKLKEGHLSSFSMVYTETLSREQSRVLAVDIWWNGEIYTVNLNALEAVSLARFWDAPDITLHPGMNFQTSTVTTSVTSKTTAAPAKTIVKKAADIKDDTADVFSGTDKALADLEERTKLSSIFSRLLSQRSFGKGSGKQKGTAKQDVVGENKTSLMEDLAGWVRWHTPFADGLIKQMHERMNTVEKLINRGDIDSALKLAFKLGNSDKKEKGKTRFPFRLPEMRSNLNFDFSGSRISMPILGGDSQYHMLQRYIKLAEELEAKGDYKRAAYIRSQLMENHKEAVLTLERGELYAEAAKLSYDSRQDPDITIRLYYKAGKTEQALALARRTGCFDKLAEDSRENNPEFHRAVLKMWTDLLLDTQQPLRALEVTDNLARSSHSKDPDPQLLALRQDWLRIALELDRQISGPDDLWPIELMMRCLLTSRFDGADFTLEMIQDFPDARILGDSVFDKVLEQIQDIVTGMRKEALQPFLTALFRHADKTQIEQAAFWQGPSRQVLDVLTRSAMNHSSETLTRSDIVELQRLLLEAPLPVLSLDLKKVTNFYKGSRALPSTISLPQPDGARTSQILQACLLFNGSMMVWYDTDRFEHRDQSGKVIWSGNISQVRAIIPIGASPSVLILRQWEEHETRLTIYDTHKRRFRDVGIIHLIAWHDVISDREWLVQIDNVVGSIDISKLFKAPAELEFHWSVNTTNELKIVAFFQKGNSSAWMTRNVSKARFGVKQLWHYKNARDLEEIYFHSNSEELNKDQIDWFWGDNNFSTYGFLKALRHGDINKAPVYFSSPDAKLRREVMAHARKRVKNGYTGLDTVQVCDFHRPLITLHDSKGLKVISENTHRNFRVKYKPDIELRLLYRGFSLNPDYSADDVLSNSILCTDNSGRLIRINNHTGRLDIF